MYQKKTPDKSSEIVIAHSRLNSSPIKIGLHKHKLLLKITAAVLGAVKLCHELETVEEKPQHEESSILGSQ